MPRSVNVWTSDWRATGEKTQTPQYAFKVQAEWTTNAGVEKQAERIVYFPDDLIALAKLGGEDRDWVGEELKELLLKVARRLAKVDGA